MEECDNRRDEYLERPYSLGSISATEVIDIRLHGDIKREDGDKGV